MLLAPVAKSFLVVAQDAYHYQRFSRPGGATEYRGIYESYSEALAAIPRRVLQGFDHDEVTGDSHFSRAMNFGGADYPVVLWLSRAIGPGATVFDFGGGLGQSYYAYRRYLDYPPGFSWIVCDVEAFVRHGEAIAREQQASHLRFTTDRTLAEGATVFLTSGTLQYVEPGLAEIVGALRKRPKHLIVHRVPLYDGRPYWTVQSSSHSYSPYKIGNTARFVAEIEAAGYELTDQWKLERTLRVPFSPRSTTVPSYKGFYFRQRTPATPTLAAQGWGTRLAEEPAGPSTALRSGRDDMMPGGKLSHSSQNRA